MEKVRKVILSLLIFSCLLFTFPAVVYGQTLQCDNRYVTLINPVRARNMWGDTSISPLTSQYGEVIGRDLPATWLLQYSAFSDKEIEGTVKKFDKSQEIGVLMEIDSNLARNARVVFNEKLPWKDPGVIFLSGYSRSERKRLIDKVFTDFEKIYGYYPKSIGAWWIDSYSLSYMRQKYGISAVLIVADQKSTDSYGVWGQWWGVAYHPSKLNVLTPAKSPGEKAGYVVLQWAQRDPDLAFGDGYSYSNYSLQANDYINLGLQSSFFESLVKKYLDCANNIGQVTIGLETGMEALGFIDEYKSQLNYLQSISGLKFSTMNSFSRDYSKVFPIISDPVTINGEKTSWKMNTQVRENSKLNERINYGDGIFEDYFTADKSSFLKRYLPVPDQRNTVLPRGGAFVISAISVLLILHGFSWKTKLLALLSIYLTFGTIFLSGYEKGYFLYFTPVVKNIYVYQILISILAPLIIWILLRLRMERVLSFYPLTFFADELVERVRYTYISESHIAGFLIDPLRMIGVSVKSWNNIKLVNFEMPNHVSDSLIFWSSNRLGPIYHLFGSPLIHLALAAAFVFATSFFVGRRMKVSKGSVYASRLPISTGVLLFFVTYLIVVRAFGIINPEILFVRLPTW